MSIIRFKKCSKVFFKINVKRACEKRAMISYDAVFWVKGV
ncbi:hypothetical protein HMPREF1417_00590 [Helicobacter pylori GAM260Bi]|nr:hypothetical protein HMPREF1397_00088 [Helicobacter pylori GAM115Ai]EMG94874.1 hypothetical protein HMPREF1399_00419 [Helicobacter pylori GAM118Bi]EMH20885.1 hypothetical protein HMPREF1417_00590 [Helicobacter pylori GAM260Bi]EMH70547.1 hypothetical protein HMPREF1452_01063 [Helicobacter pylori HP260Bi]